jgi:hypothetical protein
VNDSRREEPAWRPTQLLRQDGFDERANNDAQEPIQEQAEVVAGSGNDSIDAVTKDLP